MFKGTGLGVVKGLLGGRNKGCESGSKKGSVFMSAPPSSNFDVDAWNYILALQATNVTIPQEWKIAINKFVKAGKAHGWWDQADCIYPIIGGTAASHAINMRNPGTFTVTWNGVIAQTLQGAKPNGASGSYGDTGYNPSTMANAKLTASLGSIACYISGSPALTETAVMGNVSNTTTDLTMLRLFGGPGGTEGFVAQNNSTEIPAFPPSNSVQGFIQFTGGGSVGRNFNNGNGAATSNVGTPLFNSTMGICGAKQGGGSFNPANQIFSFFYFGGGLFKDTDLWMDVENLQVVLGRSQLGGS